MNMPIKHSGYRISFPHCFGSGLAKCVTGDQATLDLEAIVDGGVG